MNNSGPVLGIEGTAWNLSAAIFDDDLIRMKSDPYRPVQGGIHPREAAQHHAAVAAEIIQEVIGDEPEINAVAFSQGPGLGPCLRVTATAARSIAASLNVPLIGVNHCVAHVEIGRFCSGFDDPVVLYTSGANTQVFGFMQNRYRIFGETLDIGLGNAIDKFARSKGLCHPGGPEIERLAKKGSYTDLPYTVKGMDLAFSGLMSAAKDSRAPIEDVCYSFQETAFAMCVEVAERALSQTGKEEMILVGGVGANKRLQEMLRVMCEDRGAVFAVPEMKYLGDNGAMIAYTGKIMLDAGMTTLISKSTVNPSYRADQVEVRWRDEPTRKFPENANSARGAEALVTFSENEAIKERLGKRYRETVLDKRLISERTRAEARLISEARKYGVRTPVIHGIDDVKIIMEKITGGNIREDLTVNTLYTAGITIGKLHTAGIIHGDLSTCNMMKTDDDKICLVDFGLSHTSFELEDRGVDLHVLFQILKSTSTSYEELKAAFINGYRQTCKEADDVIMREHEIEIRGRYL